MQSRLGKGPLVLVLGEGQEHYAVICEGVQLHVQDDSDIGLNVFIKTLLTANEIIQAKILRLVSKSTSFSSFTLKSFTSLALSSSFAFSESSILSKEYALNVLNINIFENENIPPFDQFKQPDNRFEGFESHDRKRGATL